jgi:hypothetical protein
MGALNGGPVKAKDVGHEHVAKSMRLQDIEDLVMKRKNVLPILFVNENHYRAVLLPKEYRPKFKMFWMQALEGCACYTNSRVA